MTTSLWLSAALLFGASSELGAASLIAPAPNSCVAAATNRPSDSPSSLLARAAAAMHVPVDGRVLRFAGAQSEEQSFQSDRPYPPYFSAFASLEYWYSPLTRVERTSQTNVFPGTGPAARPQTLVSGFDATFMVRDTMLVPVPALASTTRLARSLNPWAVVADWQKALGPVAARGDESAAPRVVGTCIYREFPRVVLARGNGVNEERLYLDVKSGNPVKLEREESHYLFGQQRVEYLWTTWIAIGTSNYPSSSVRVADGRTEISRTVGTAELVRADSAPGLTVPEVSAMPDVIPMFLRPDMPDTVRVDANTFLLSNRGYRHAVTLQRDTVWLFEATQGETRARGDSVWIGRLFPGRHPIAVVITDLAWPHIAGARFWAAAGARIITHPTFVPFLRETLARRWTRSPDLLERRRALVRLHIDTVLGDRAGGAVRLAPINGIASEGALLGWVPSAGFLWGSDFVQTLSERAVYTNEVASAVKRMGVTPQRVAAQHLPLSPWSALVAMADKQ